MKAWEGGFGQGLEWVSGPDSKVKEQELSTVVTAYLDGKGLLPENGYIVDASFVEVPRQRNTRVENASIKEC